jgi:isoleucyl-tRNA synthetase
MVARLSQMLAPMLAFTADEAWEAIPGIPVPSVHLGRWEPSTFAPPESEAELWRGLFELRAAALPELEKARQSKLIGKALDAVLFFTVPEPVAAATGAHVESLRELCNVSGLELSAGAEPSVRVRVASELGRRRCERCWHWETDVGAEPPSPALCGRCAGALAGLPAA